MKKNYNNFRITYLNLKVQLEESKNKAIAFIYDYNILTILLFLIIQGIDVYNTYHLIFHSIHKITHSLAEFQMGDLVGVLSFFIEISGSSHLSIIKRPVLRKGTIHKIPKRTLQVYIIITLLSFFFITISDEIIIKEILLLSKEITVQFFAHKTCNKLSKIGIFLKNIMRYIIHLF